MPGNRRTRVFLFPFGNNKWGNFFSACVLRTLGQEALLVVDGQTEDDYGFGIRKSSIQIVLIKELSLTEGFFP